MLVEHPFSADWKLREPKPTERARAVYRFAAAVAPGKSTTVTVVEERQLEQVVSLANLRSDVIELYLRAPEVSEKVKEALQEVAGRQQSLAALRAQLRRNETRVKEIGAEQRRIRDNMARLSRTSELYQRYVQILTKQEDELGELRQRLGELRVRQDTQQKALDAYLLSLDLD